MASAVEALESLAIMLRARRLSLLERMGKGLAEDNLREHIGRNKELIETLEKLNKQIQNINGDVDETEPPARR